MSIFNDHELLLWAMRAGLTRDEVRGAVRHGLDAGRIPRQWASESEADRQARFDTVRDYLQDQYLAGYQEYRQGIQARRAQSTQDERGQPIIKEGMSYEEFMRGLTAIWERDTGLLWELHEYAREANPQWAPQSEGNE